MRENNILSLRLLDELEIYAPSQRPILVTEAHASQQYKSALANKHFRIYYTVGSHQLMLASPSLRSPVFTTSKKRKPKNSTFCGGLRYPGMHHKPFHMRTRGALEV